MKANWLVSRVAGLEMAGALAVGCLLSQCETGAPLSFTARAEAARMVRVIDADTYIMLSGATTCRLRLLGVLASDCIKGVRLSCGFNRRHETRTESA